MDYHYFFRRQLTARIQSVPRPFELLQLCEHKSFVDIIVRQPHDVGEITYTMVEID